MEGIKAQTAGKLAGVFSKSADNARISYKIRNREGQLAGIGHQAALIVLLCNSKLIIRLDEKLQYRIKRFEFAWETVASAAQSRDVMP